MKRSHFPSSQLEQTVGKLNETKIKRPGTIRHARPL